MVDSYLSTKFHVYSIHGFWAPRVHGHHQKTGPIQYLINWTTRAKNQPELGWQWPHWKNFRPFPEDYLQEGFSNIPTQSNSSFIVLALPGMDFSAILLKKQP